MARSKVLTIARIENLLSGYRRLIQSEQQQSSTQIRANFARIRNALKPLLRSADKRIADEAEHFNIFRVLHVERKEVLTHSPFSANLFDPSGSHAQGNLFLRCLFERLKSKKVRGLPELKPEQTWIVQTEQKTDTGRLDIVIYSYVLATRIVIENKIGARDQERQLQRYHKQMQALKNVFWRCRLLLYLTPEGRRSEEADASEEKPDYICLSYHNDIVSILTAALSSLKPEGVKQLLEQYKTVTTELTNATYL
jgi:hypothetical protein